MRCSAAAYQENPFCRQCLHERAEKASAALGPTKLVQDGDYVLVAPARGQLTERKPFVAVDRSAPPDPRAVTSLRFTIEGRPTTKKNSQRIINLVGKHQVGSRKRIVQSRQYLAWEQAAVAQLRSQWARWNSRCAPSERCTSLEAPVNMAAIIYRDRDVGDLLNYAAAVSDALEAAGVLVNDRLVTGLDGCRLALDRARPRVEVTLSW